MIFLRKIYYSFPVRLAHLHLRNHLVLMALWLFLAGLVGGYIGKFFGMEYLLLTPEYRGKVDFLSFFLTGMAFGWFYMTWNLTTYLLCADRFSFLATLKAPFTKFSLNNSFFPLIFVVYYLVSAVRFQWHDEFTTGLRIFSNLVGFVVGFSVLVFVLSGYLFFTNKDIYSFLHLGQLRPKAGGRLLAPGRRLPTLWEIRSGATRWRVDTYLNERLRPRMVRSVEHYNFDILKQVFQQNHLNAAWVQVTGMLILIIFGAFMENPWFRIPTGATIFMLASMVVAAFGAIAFWFRQWGTLAFLLVLFLVNYVTSFGLFNFRNQAYGLDYSPKNLAEYSLSRLDSMSTLTNIDADKAETQKILANWLIKNARKDGKKPKMVFVCVSGGGMRSAIWTLHSLQQLDAKTNGQLFRQTALMTGASGGTLGTAFFREAYWQYLQGDTTFHPHHERLLELLSKDLLNPVSFAIVSNDLFFPLKSFSSGKHKYLKDRGYMFEKTLNENCGGIMDKTIGDYRLAEQRAEIPMLFVHPFITNDSRQMIISPQKVSYMMHPDRNMPFESLIEVDAVDFGRLFAEQDADDLRLTSALRMNSTFPLILPSVLLPTKPAIEVMDAGLRDNYGIRTAARFIHVFKDWIRENTSGAVIVQIRCWPKNEIIQESDNVGAISNILTPAGLSTKITTINDYESDNAVALLGSVLGEGMLDVLHFVYEPVHAEAEASLNLHISRRERIDILTSFFLENNQKSKERLNQLLND